MTNMRYGCIRPFLSLWRLNPQTNKQPADPRAILLLTTFRRQTFAISINEIKEGWGQWSLCCVVCRQSAAIWGATIWFQILMLCALAADKAERSGVCRSIDRRCVGGGCSTPHHLLPVHGLDYPFQLLEYQWREGRFDKPTASVRKPPSVYDWGNLNGHRWYF